MSNFSGVAFCLPHQLVGFLIHNCQNEIIVIIIIIMFIVLSSCIVHCESSFRSRNYEVRRHGAADLISY